MQEALFLILCAVALGGALGLVFAPKALYGALSLTLSLFSLGGLFWFLKAPFAGVLQLLVYVGAIMTLFVFVIMLVHMEAEPDEKKATAPFVGPLAAFLFLFSLAPAVVGLGGAPAASSLGHLAQHLYGPYLLPFELMGLLLFVTVTGVAFLTRGAKGQGDQ